MTVDEFDVLTTQLARLRVQQASEPTPNAAASDPVVPGSGLAEQIALLESALRRAVVERPGARNSEDRGFALAAVGTIVDAHDGAKTCRYRLTLGVEARDHGDVLAISAFSPVGAALMGRAVDDTVDVVLPRGRHRSLEVRRIVGDR